MTWEAAVAVAKVTQVVTGTLAQVVSMTHPQITLVNKMTALLPSTQLDIATLLSSRGSKLGH